MEGVVLVVVSPLQQGVVGVVDVMGEVGVLDVMGEVGVAYLEEVVEERNVSQSGQAGGTCVPNLLEGADEEDNLYAVEEVLPEQGFQVDDLPEKGFRGQHVRVDCGDETPEFLAGLLVLAIHASLEEVETWPLVRTLVHHASPLALLALVVFAFVGGGGSVALVAE